MGSLRTVILAVGTGLATGAPEGPCDIYASAGSPCVAAHSVVRSLYADYTGPLYRILRDSDFSSLDIVANANGFAKIVDQDKFCAGTSCYILRIFDQSPEKNHLDTAPAGGACRPPGGAGLKPVNATREQISIGGQSVYGAYFEGGQGYRRDVTSGVATGEGEETMYMVTRGDHVNGGCCFDYGNAETNNLDDGQGTMEAVYFGTSKGWGHGQGNGPWVMADLENGLWAGNERSAPAPSISYQYVTAMAKGKKGGFALKGGNAQSGTLQTLHEGVRPAGYETMKKQGAIILGIGGDASCQAVGTFYEGVMTGKYTTDEADNAVQANIVSIGYGKTPPSPSPSPPSAGYTQIGNHEYCTNTPRYMDGPDATASDGACRSHCDTDVQCMYYAWWSDHGCRTWDSCQTATNPYSGTTATLWQRSAIMALRV